MSSIDTVQTFLNHVFSGATDDALAMVASDARFISTRPTQSETLPIFGTFRGPAGAKEFFGLFAELLEPGEFNVVSSFSEGKHVAMYGDLKHKSKKTGKEFVSDWALICEVQESRIALYHFYEDTAALYAAMH